MQPIPDPVIKKLEAAAHAGKALTTDAVRALMALTNQQYQRLTLHEGFPRRERISRKFLLNPQHLLDFALHWNALAAGVTITQVAVLIHATIPTARRLAKLPDFPEALGEVNGRKRWDREVITQWHRKRLGDAALDAEFDVGPDERKKKPAAKRGTNGGKHPTKRANT